MGHHRYIKLPAPVIHPLYAKQVAIMASIVCNNCGLLLASDRVKKTALRLKPWMRLEYLEKRARNHETDCPRCGSVDIDGETIPNRKWHHKGFFERSDVDRSTYLLKHQYKKDEYTMTPDEIGKLREIFSMIDVNDAHVLGLGDNHPEDLILTMIPVPPLFMRPPTVAPGQTSETNNPITNALENLLVDDTSGAPYIGNKAYIPENFPTTQDDESLEMDEDKLKAWRAYNAEIRRLMLGLKTDENAKKTEPAIQRRQRGKFGDILSKLNARPMADMGRTVGGPGDDQHFGEAGIPENMANGILVTRILESKEHVLNLVKSGVPVNLIFKRSGFNETISLKQYAYDEVAGVYDLTQRNMDMLDKAIVGKTLYQSPIRSGDIVLIFRQPILHRFSIRALRVRILPPGVNTMKIRLDVAGGMNLDFDGDEVNLTAVSMQLWRELMSMSPGVSS